ncbi:hypothetical protein K7432_000193 [Basidiobolus ranarum]|uniref:Ser-Thr-rich glycosyl-phosphatidyl-inositol-anchored membrane family-domain-containing protein n=1 Tax=Basidiobolus ranarum TaxID=34480 RepID=A0ABR2X4X9_9FUNG
MRTFITLSLIAVASLVSAAPLNKCGDWSVAPLTHATGNKSTFAANDKVTLKWNVGSSRVKYIREISISSSKSNRSLHTQYRRYPGEDATTGKLSFTLSVPLCLQREGEYYLEVVSSTPGNDGDCIAKTPDFKLTPDPNGNYTFCPTTGTL